MPIYRFKGQHESATISNVVVSVTPPMGVRHVLLQVTDADVRYSISGTDPVAATTGFLLYDGRDPVMVDVTPGNDLKFIRDAGDDAVLQYQYMRS